MLVCSVVLRPHRTVAAIVAEHAAALADVRTLGTGQLVEETASATAIADALAIYRTAIVESGSAADAPSATVTTPGAIAGTVAEAASAADAPDATVAGTVATRSAMVGTVFVNSDGTARQANADGVMVNL